jgi:tetratricopeptide (TPR) repeat protein
MIAIWPFRMAVMQREQFFNDRSGALSRQEYDLLAKLKNSPVNSAQYLEWQDELGMVYWQQKKWLDADRVFRATQVVLKAQAKPDPYAQSYVTVTEHLAGLCRDRGQFFFAIDLYKEILAYDEHAAKVDDQKLARDYANIGVVQYFNALSTEDKNVRQTYFVDSQDKLQKSIDLYTKALGPNSQQVGNELATQALVLRDMGREGEAERVKRESERIRALVKTPSAPP